MEDISSPQSQALAWLEGHQNLTNLPEWRKRQLFALATFYYSFDGPHWPFGWSEDWLDDSKSECDWYSTAYGDIDIKHITPDILTNEVNGDIYDRIIVRLLEVKQSIEILEQAIDEMPSGDIVSEPKIPKLLSQIKNECRRN